jgi:phosphoglycerol transferase MdoB-like AlkP superfamily enzyme
LPRIIFLGLALSKRSDVPRDSSDLERNVAVWLRSFIFLLLGYVAIHRVFPFDLLGVRLGDMNGADFLLLVFRTVISIAGVLYFVTAAFALPPISKRNTTFCEWWASLGLGVISIIGCAFIARFVKGEGLPESMARVFGRGILWLLI